MPLKANTRRDYERAVRVAFAPWKALPLGRINTDMIIGRFDELSERSPAQANQAFRFLRSLFRWAMWRYRRKDGTPLLPANPCGVGTKRWNRLKERKRYIKPHQLAQFMTALEPDANDRGQRRAVKDLAALLVLTGLREQEGCQLLWANVNLEERTFTVPDPKNGRDQTLPMGTWLTVRLAARRSLTGQSPYVFPAENKCGHLKNHRPDRVAIAKKAGVEFTFHDLRRTFANVVDHHLERTFSKYTIKALLNHSSGGDVTAGYIDHSVEALREPMETVENFMLRAAGMLESALVVELRKAA